jgi:hypothetical protein
MKDNFQIGINIHQYHVVSPEGPEVLDAEVRRHN